MMNTITSDAINKVQELVESQEKIIEINGKSFSRFLYNRVINDPRPSSMNFSTLGGVADYIKNNLDEVGEKDCVIVIDDFDQVSVYSPVLGEKNDRHLIAKCTLDDVDKFPFGKWLDQETFIIKFASLFANENEWETILQAVTSMSVKMENGGEDDGSSVIKQASERVIIGGVKPAPVVTLSPFRTFRELEQPASQFIFRYKAIENAPFVGLFEADGGAWKIAAKELIKNYLNDRLDKTPIFC